MSIKWKKPNWYPDKDVIATNNGWVYIKNHNEVLEAISHLKDKLDSENNDTGFMDLTAISFDKNVYVFQSSGSINKENILTSPTDASYKSYNATITDLAIGDTRSLDKDNNGNYQFPQPNIGYLNLSKLDNTKITKSVAYIICGGASFGLMYNNHMNKNSSSYMIKAIYFDTPTDDMLSSLKQVSSPTLEDMQIAFTPYSKTVVQNSSKVTATSSDDSIAKIASVNLGSGQSVFQITTFNKSGDITFTFNDGNGHIWTHNATVVDTPFIESIKIVGDGFDLSESNNMYISERKKLKIETTPSNLPYTNITWKSSNPNIIEVSNDGDIYYKDTDSNSKDGDIVTISASINGDPTINPIVYDEVDLSITVSMGI